MCNCLIKRHNGIRHFLWLIYLFIFFFSFRSIHSTKQFCLCSIASCVEPDSRLRTCIQRARISSHFNAFESRRRLVLRFDFNYNAVRFIHFQLKWHRCVNWPRMWHAVCHKLWIAVSECVRQWRSSRHTEPNVDFIRKNRQIKL